MLLLQVRGCFQLPTWNTATSSASLLRYPELAGVGREPTAYYKDHQVTSIWVVHLIGPSAGSSCGTVSRRKARHAELVAPAKLPARFWLLSYSLCNMSAGERHCRSHLAVFLLGTIALQATSAGKHSSGSCLAYTRGSTLSRSPARPRRLGVQQRRTHCHIGPSRRQQALTCKRSQVFALGCRSAPGPAAGGARRWPALPRRALWVVPLPGG